MINDQKTASSFLPSCRRLYECNAGDTGSRNLYEKLEQVVLYKKLARLSVNLVQVAYRPISLIQVSCTHEHSSIRTQKLSGT